MQQRLSDHHSPKLKENWGRFIGGVDLISKSFVKQNGGPLRAKITLR